MDEDLNTIEGTARADFLRGSWQDDLILAGAGNDLILARAGNDIVDAGDGNDRVFAGSGDDLVKTGLGRDFADGGAGVDTAQFDGDSTDYRISSFFGLTFVTDLRNGETDTLVRFEFLQFDDGLFDIDGNPVASDPEAVDDEASTIEDTAITINVLANDSDPNNDPLTVTEATATNGTVDVNTDGTLRYTPPENFSGEDTITYTISDGNGGTSTATVTVQVDGVADAPSLMAPKTYETIDLEEIMLADLVADLVDRDGSERLKIKFGNLPEGAVILNKQAIADKEAQIAVLNDQIDRLQAETGALEGQLVELRALIDDLEQNDPTSDRLPALREQRDTGEARLEQELTRKLELETDRAKLELEKGELSKTAGPDGMVEFDDLGSGFALQLPPGTTKDFVLEVHAIATESDPVASEDVRTAESSVEIEIVVKESPSAEDDKAITKEDTPVTIRVLDNDTDSDGDELTIMAVTDGANGTVVINEDGTVDYRPNRDFSGEDTFTYTVEDGNGGVSTATVSVLVGGVADRPQLFAAQSVGTRDLADIELVQLTAALVDRDGSEKLTLQFSNLPQGAVILNPAAIAAKDGQIAELGSLIDALGADLGQLKEDIDDVSKQIEELERDNPDSEDLPPLREQRANLQKQLAEKTDARSKAQADLDQAKFDKAQLTKEADANGEIEFHDLGSGFVLRLAEGTTEDFILRVKAIATESDPVLDDEDREAVNGVVINVSLLESPEANDDTAVTAEDTPVTINVLDNDVDSDGDPLTVIDVLGVSNGSADLNDDGTITFTPDPNFSGEAEFTYTIADGNGGVSDATVKVLVGGVADTPNLLLPNALETFDLSPILLDRIDASLMDTDGSESLKVKFRGLPQGTKIENPGAIAANTTQIDDLRAENQTFARQRTEAEEELVFLNGRLQDAEADPNFPPGELEDLRNRKAGVEDLIKGLVARTAENEATVAELFKQNEQLSQMADGNGEIEFHGFGDGFLMQLPEGTVDNLQIKVDATSIESEPLAGPEFETATISRSFQIIVRESLAPQDDVATTIEDAPVTIFATANDVGESLKIIEVGVPANGTAVIDDNGDLLYTPNANFGGVDTFNYLVTDAFGVAETATVQVTVGGVADTPNLALPDGLLTTDLAPISLDGIQASLVDLDDSESLTVKFGGLPEGSNISFPSRFAAFNGRLEVVEADIARNEALTAETERNLAETNAAIDDLSTITDPTEDQLNELARLEQGRDALQGELQVLSDQRAEFVARRDELRAIVEDLSQTADKDGHIEIKGFGPGFILQLPDGVIDDFKLTVEAIATESDPLASPDTLRATASGEVQVSVRESPQAVDDMITVREDEAGVINVVANDLDSDGDALTIVNVTDGAHGTTEDLGGGNIRYTPKPDFSGEDQFTYTVEDPDGNSSTATVRVVVNGVADVPTLTSVPENLQTIDLADIDLSGITAQLNDTDGSETLVIRFSGLPQGSVVTNPQAIADLNDEGNGLAATIKVLQTDVRSNEELLSERENELRGLLDSGTATDDQIAAKRQEIEDLTRQISDDNREIASANGRLAEIDAELGSFTLRPDIDGVVGISGETSGWVLQLPAGSTENFSFDVEAVAIESDPVAGNEDRTATSDKASIFVGVRESSRAEDDSVETDEDTPIDINVLANDLGDSNAPVDVVDVSEPTNGAVQINANGTITYTPFDDFNGTDTFTYTIEDEIAGQSTATVNVTVAPVNDPPEGGPALTGTPEVGQILRANPDPIDDPDGIRSIDQYVWQVSVDGINNWEIILGAFGPEFEVPPEAEGKFLRVEVLYTDGGGKQENAASSPTAAVAAAPDANQDPIAVPNIATTEPNKQVEIDVLGNDFDPDGDPLFIESVSPPSNGQVEITPEGNVLYTPAIGFVGFDSFTYDVFDGNGGIATATVRVSVAEPVDLGGGGGGTIIVPPIDGGGGRPPEDGGGKEPPGGGGGVVIIVPTPILPNPIVTSLTPSQELGDAPMTGTPGNDVFLFSQGDGAVNLLGFQQATDTAGEVADQIQLAGFGLAFADLDTDGNGQVGAGDAGVSGGDGVPLALDFGGGDVLSVNGVSFLTEDDLLFV